MKKKLHTLLTRLRNKKVILSIVSGVVLILTSTDVIDVARVNHIDVIVNTVLSILIGLGIVSDPESHIKE